ncbi:MAG: cation:proton antiporter [Vulcanococcus sp.]
MTQLPALLLSLPGASPEAPLDSIPVELQVLFIGMVYLGSLLISRLSIRIGIPAILGVLGLGLLINIQVLNVTPEDVGKLQLFSLALLLFYAGLKTDLQAIRGFLNYGLMLAIGGVMLSTLVLGVGLLWMGSEDASGLNLGLAHTMPISVAMLVAACLGSTDTGPTVSVLQQVGRLMPERLRHLLEFESAVNDPSALITYQLCTVLFIGGAASTGSTLTLAQTILSGLIQQLASGLLLGIGFGYLARLLINRLVMDKEQLLIVAMSIAFIDYGFTHLMGGSGLVAVYVTGVFMTNLSYHRPELNHEALQEVLAPFNTMTEITIFLLFGLLVNPADLLPSLPIGIGAAALLMLVARPLSVLCFQPFSPFSWRESLLISWCGMRGAVPLALSFNVVLAMPQVRDLPAGSADLLAHNAQSIVFIVVILNLLVQGLSLPPLCRWINAPGAPASSS